MTQTPPWATIRHLSTPADRALARKLSLAGEWAKLGALQATIAKRASA